MLLMFPPIAVKADFNWLPYASQKMFASFVKTEF